MPDSYEHLKSHYDRIQSEQRTEVERERDEALAALKNLYDRAICELADPEDVDELVQAGLVLTRAERRDEAHGSADSKPERPLQRRKRTDVECRPERAGVDEDGDAMSKRVYCPACSCDVSDRVRDAAAIRASRRMNKQQVERVAKLLTNAEELLQDPARHSVGPLWRADVRAIRYVFNRMMSELGRNDEAQGR